MTQLHKVSSLALLLAISLSAGNLAADTATGAAQGVGAQKLYSGMAEEVDRDAEQFQNSSQQNQLQHRLNEQEKENAEKARHEKQQQKMHKNQHQYQNKTQTSRPQMDQSGSMKQMRQGKGGGGPR